MAAPTGGAATGGTATLLPGSICVTLGFEQHFGECWNDSLSMLLLFADGYKEITQPLLIDTTSHPALIDAFMKKISPPLPKEDDISLRNMLEEYLQYLSYRFQYHVKHIQEQGNRVLKKNRDLRRLSLHCSLKTATGILNILNFLKKHDRYITTSTKVLLMPTIAVKTGMERGWVGYEPVGVFHTTKMDVLNLLHIMFGITDKTIFEDFSRNGQAYILSIQIKDEDDDAESHSICIFKCDKRWYLYDDNRVILKEFAPTVTREKEFSSQIETFYEENGFSIKVESIVTIENIGATTMRGGKTRRNRRARKTRKSRR